MPLILFPTALTNSLAVMLLPAVSELNLETIIKVLNLQSINALLSAYQPAY